MYRIYLYLVWDGQRVARIEVDDHRKHMQFPEVLAPVGGRLVGGPVIPSSYFALETDVEIADVA